MILAFLWYGFVVFRKGIEYRFHEESVMDLIVLSAVTSWLLGRAGFIIANWSVFSVNWLRIGLINSYPGYDLVGIVLGLMLSVFLVASREEIVFFKGIDLLFLGFMSAVPFERLGRVLVGDVRLWRGLPIELFQALGFLLVFVLMWRMEGEYRTYAWFRNRQTEAKNGFIAGIGLVFFGGLMILSSWWGSLSLYQLVFGGVSTFIGSIWLYFRSGRGLHNIGVKLLKKRK